MIIDWGEETIHKTNETPCDVECNGYWKKNDAANREFSQIMFHF